MSGWGNDDESPQEKLWREERYGPPHAEDYFFVGVLTAFVLGVTWGLFTSSEVRGLVLLILGIVAAIMSLYGLGWVVIHGCRYLDRSMRE
jgi:hypothetical protein